MTGTGRGEEDPRRQAMPARVRWTLLAGVGLLLAGALYLFAVRGEALLVDLGDFVRSCFGL
jgi:hypothetical protein